MDEGFLPDIVGTEYAQSILTDRMVDWSWNN